MSEAKVDLKTRMRNLAFELLSVSREMGAQTDHSFDDINDLTFRMKSCAVLLMGYAPQELPHIGTEAEKRAELFN